MTSGCFIQTLVILYKNVGIAMVSTLVATVLSIAASVPVAKLQEHYQDKLMATKDERMRKTSECVTPQNPQLPRDATKHDIQPPN
jgi:hypothetical protein